MPAEPVAVSDRWGYLFVLQLDDHMLNSRRQTPAAAAPS